MKSWNLEDQKAGIKTMKIYPTDIKIGVTEKDDGSIPSPIPVHISIN
jgi:hypothetical protein